MSEDTFTNVPGNIPDITLEDLSGILGTLPNNFLDRFKGVPVMEDVNLPPGRWCCVVSSDIYKELKEAGMTK